MISSQQNQQTSAQSVSLEQIEALENKIAVLNEQLAHMQQRSVDT